MSPEWDRRLKDHSKLKEVKLTLEWDMGLKDQLKLKLKEKEWVLYGRFNHMLHKRQKETMSKKEELPHEK